MEDEITLSDDDDLELPEELDMPEEAEEILELDEDTEEEIMQILTSLVKNEGCCVILATHSHKVASYADEVLGLSDGRLVTVNQRSGLE